jgi:hypothetical protein
MPLLYEKVSIVPDSVNGRIRPEVYLLTLDFWDCSGHGLSSLVFVLCCVRSILYDELITLSEKSYRMCVIYELQRGVLTPS